MLCPNWSHRKGTTSLLAAAPIDIDKCQRNSTKIRNEVSRSLLISGSLISTAHKSPQFCKQDSLEDVGSKLPKCQCVHLALNIAWQKGQCISSQKNSKPVTVQDHQHVSMYYTDSFSYNQKLIKRLTQFHF